MNTKKLADLLGVHSDSVRRWAAQFAPFMSDGATPNPGEARRFTKHDAAVMLLVATMRGDQRSLNEIGDRLVELQRNRWQDLPPAPDEWFIDVDQIRAMIPEDADDSDELHARFMAKRATEYAQLTVMKHELQITRRELDEAQARVEVLQQEIDALQASERASQSEVNTLRIELEAERGKVNTLSAQLQQYALGGKTPVPVGAILIRAAIAGAALVAAALVLARVLL